MGRRLDRRPGSGDRPALGAAEGQHDARVLPTGHLVYTRGATIFAVPFDETRLTVTGVSRAGSAGDSDVESNRNVACGLVVLGNVRDRSGPLSSLYQLLVLGQPGRPRGANGTASSELRDTLIGVARCRRTGLASR